MRWTAVVPLKLDDRSKSRLGAVLPVDARIDLGEAMVRHVLSVLSNVRQIDQVVLLTSKRPLWWDGDWADDKGAALNAALTEWRTTHGDGAIVVIHGDLPYLSADDVSALLGATVQTGAAMATDTHGTGTNALALADGRPFAFRFGVGSKAAHTAAGQIALIDRRGLAKDIDTPSDLAALIETGFTFPPP